VLIYADPPYLGSTRTGGRYKHEMLTSAQHEELAESLHQARAGVVLSGYPSPLHERPYAGWDRVEIPTTTGRSGTPLDRTEVVWSNRPIAEPGCSPTTSSPANTVPDAPWPAVPARHTTAGQQRRKPLRLPRSGTHRSAAVPILRTTLLA
jgi:hypothetical protein